MAARFDYAQAEEIRDAFARHGVRFLFIGKSGAILLGFPDTTQDAEIFLERSPENGRAVVAALREMGFALTDAQAAEIERGKDFVQLKNGPFDLDLFGSRATGHARSTSDWDVGILGPQRLRGALLQAIRDDLDALPTLHTFDVVDLADVPEDFRDRALSDAVRVA
jgi:predicted nucleotidyltransferase